MSDPREDDEPPFFPMPDPDAPERPDWFGEEPEGEQMPEAE